MGKQSFEDSLLSGTNAPYVEAIYEDYLKNPALVSLAWRRFFENLHQADESALKPPLSNTESKSSPSGHMANVEQVSVSVNQPADTTERKQVAVLQLINAYRYLGINKATLDPIKREEKPDVPELEPAHYGFAEADMETVFNTGTLVGPERSTLNEILQTLKQTYCGTIGAEYMYMTDVEQKRWIQSRLEGCRANPAYSAEQKLHILERLNAAEGLEKYLHTRYVGQKRFSGEGNESLIPLLDNLLQRAGQQGVEEIVIGMAHRARLNVLVNTLGKMPSDLFKEFEGKQIQDLPSGDVKYHQGFSSAIKTPGGTVRLALAFNPSHLEIVGPVVEGSVRARQHRLGDKEGNLVLPVLLHGDAAYAGQGVVMETLNLSQTRGYGTGGTVHVIINNQIGFTTSDTRDSRSTQYCTDISKMIEAPIFHVNGDDPEAVSMVTEIALDFRMKFHKDVVIDMVCFRRLGHNELDEPMVTQPAMYKIIRQHPGTRKLYASKLEAEGIIKAGEADAMVQDFRNAMDAGNNPNKTICTETKSEHSVNWAPYLTGETWDEKVKTGLTIKELRP